MATNMEANMGGIPVSAPGAMSTRTDLGVQGAQPLPDAQYGENARFQEIQRGAPMAATMPPPPPMPAGLFAPTARPDEPVSAGAAFGEGPGPDALPRPVSAKPRLSDTLRRMAQADRGGDTEYLLALAQRLGW